jgi:L-ascorbate metabolism protein UlaG (beta-lactamase superfamily)
MCRQVLTGTLAFAAFLLAACSRADAPPAPVTPPPAVDAAPSAVAAPAGPSASTATAPDASADTSPRRYETLATSKGDLAILPIHHASILFTFAKRNIYVDPWTEGNLHGLPKADFIFLTHAHPDHLDYQALTLLKESQTKVYGSTGVAKKLALDVTMPNGKRFDVPGVEGFSVESVPMYNLVRGPTPDTRYHPKGDGNGYVFTFGDKRVYVSGDTECTPEMRALKNIDVAFVCMNLPYTMTPEEAGDCVKAFRPKIVYPYHYKGSDLDEFAAKLNGTGIVVRRRDWY